jgi:hypothetical protein
VFIRGYIRALRLEVILKGAKHTPFPSDCFYHTKTPFLPKKTRKNINNLISFNNLKARPKNPLASKVKL